MMPLVVVTANHINTCIGINNIYNQNRKQISSPKQWEAKKPKVTKAA